MEEIDREEGRQKIKIIVRVYNVISLRATDLWLGKIDVEKLGLLVLKKNWIK